MQVAHSGVCVLTERESKSSKPGVEILLLFSITSFFSLLTNHLPKDGVFPSASCVKKKKSSGVINYLFQSIAFELTISGRFVKEKPRRLSLNRIVKEKP